MAAVNLPDLRITEDSETTDIKRLIEIIKPSWDSEQLSIKELSGGYSGRIIRCYERDKREDSVTVRVRRLMDIMTKGKFDNVLELTVIQHLSKLGHFPKVHAIFANGYCYQYVEGKPMINVKEKTGHVDDRMLKAIADEMAFIHSLKIESVEYNEESVYRVKEAILNIIDSEKPTENGINKKVLIKEHDLVYNFLRSKKPKIVLCHGDPHPGNYVWNEEQKKITIVDWEGTRVGYQLSEIAQFFIVGIRMIVGFSLLLHGPQVLDGQTIAAGEIFLENYFSRAADEGLAKDFLKYYVKSWRELQNDNRIVTEEDVNRWMEEIEIFRLEPMLKFVTISYVYPKLFIESTGNENIANVFQEEYLKLKETFLGKGSFESEE